MRLPLAVATRNLAKRYGRVEALRGVDLAVPEGAVYGFIGQNGAGKTTTLRILAGLLLPGGGEACVAGRDVVRERRQLHRLIGYMPDFFGVYDDLRAGEYLEFYAGTYGIRGSLACSLRDELLELVDLTEKREAFVDTLSRGMQQRLCLARALIHDPPVLLLDEPASGLDPLARVEMREILKQLRGLGKTIIISSHILSELADLCTHIGMVAGGRLLRQGTLEEVLGGEHQRTLMLRCLGPVEAARQLVENWPGAQVINLSGQQVEFSLAGGAAEMAALLAAAVEQGLKITHFAETAGSLEDAFLRLVREEDRQEEVRACNNQ